MTCYLRHNGILVTDMVDGQYVKHFYIGYTANEAKALFKSEFHHKPKRVLC